jgi:hypothetical protein
VRSRRHGQAPRERSKIQAMSLRLFCCRVLAAAHPLYIHQATNQQAQQPPVAIRGNAAIVIEVLSSTCQRRTMAEGASGPCSALDRGCSRGDTLPPPGLGLGCGCERFWLRVLALLAAVLKAADADDDSCDCSAGIHCLSCQLPVTVRLALPSATARSQA